jgi:hypothetical protein
VDFEKKSFLFCSFTCILLDADYYLFCAIGLTTHLKHTNVQKKVPNENRREMLKIIFVPIRKQAKKAKPIPIEH